MVVEGEGIVTSNPAGIECGSGRTLCEKAFASEVKSIALTAMPPTDGSYEFFKWVGGCSDSDPICILTEKSDVKAVFLSTDVFGSLPTKPNGMQVSAMSTKVFLVQWGASSDLVTPSSELQYRIYFSDTPENIIALSNLIDTVAGTSALNHSYDLDVETTGVVSDTSEYVIGITSLDTDGFESQPLILANQRLMDEDIELIAGLNLIDGAETGFPTPTITEDNTNIYYRFEDVDVTLIPIVGDFVAYPTEEDGLAFHQLLKVTEIDSNGFLSVVSSLSEITTKPVIASGSGIGQTRKQEWDTHFKIRNGGKEWW